MEGMGLRDRLQFNEDFKLDWHDDKEAHDGYQLKWVGKNYARLQAGTMTETVIIPDVTHNEKEINKNSNNLFFTGDNLEVLKHLQNAYAGKIKMIYIDPPYNTGGEFVYPDKFSFTDEQLKDMLGYSDDIKRLHSINGRSSHSAWLTFMYPRLKLARKLLTDDGVIFISIDDNEQANLKLLCDEIFGEINFVAQMIWQQGRKSTGKKIATNHEYCLVYTKNIEIILNLTKSDYEDDIVYWKEKKQCLDIVYKKEKELYEKYVNDYQQMSKEMTLFYKSFDEDDPIQSLSHYKEFDERGIYFPDNTCAPDIPETRSHRPLIHPITKKETAVPSKGWRFKDETLDVLVADNRIHFGKDENKIPNVKRYLRETEYELAQSVFYKDNRGATTRLTNLFGNKIFENPKDEFVIQKFLKYCALKHNDIVLDFFAGSATTAHAVMQLNVEDVGGDVQYIMVQLPEQTEEDSEARKAGFNTIDEISRKRIELSANKIKAETAKDIDYGFKHYYVKNAEVDTIDKIVEFDPGVVKLIADDMVSEFNNEYSKGEDVILTTWLVDDGYRLNQDIEVVDFSGYKAYYLDNSLLYLININWTSEQTKQLLNVIGEHKLNINTIIVYGYSFTLESLKELEIAIKQNFDNGIQIEKRY